MRRIATALCICVTACAGARKSARPLLGPDLDDAASGAEDPGVSVESVRIQGHALRPHARCSAVVRQRSGAVRCPGAGHLAWAYAPDPATALDQRDFVAARVAELAGQQHARLQRAEFDCEIAATPGSCRAYVVSGSSGTWSEVIGLAPVERGSLLAECVSLPGKAAFMKPVCSDVFGVR